MKYARFEALVLTIGAVTVLGSMLFTIGGEFVVEEAVAQVLLFGVLFGAVHWGRSGGFVAALLATALYLAIRIPLVMSGAGFTLDVASLVTMRVLTYGLVGIVGGELCTRIKYVFARLEGSASIDEWSKIYNQRFIVRALESAGGQFARYDTPYSALVIELSPRLFENLRPSRQRSLVRSVASYLRGDIRLVDEAARLDDGRFLVLLPHTPRQGGTVVASRIHRGICDALGARDDSIAVRVLGAPEDAPALLELRSELASVLSPIDEAAQSST